MKQPQNHIFVRHIPMENSMFEHNEIKNPVAEYLIWGGVILAFLSPFVFAALMASALDFNSGLAFPTDAELIKNFQDNEADFEHLNQMAKEDSDFTRIAYGFNWTKESVAYPRSKSKKNLSPERWNEYRDLFTKLHLEDGIDNIQPKSVWFTASSKGMVTGGSSKGYMYLTEEPSLILDSLDDLDFGRPELKGKDFRILYKKLKGSWYLFYESS